MVGVGCDDPGEKDGAEESQHDKQVSKWENLIVSWDFFEMRLYCIWGLG